MLRLPRKLKAGWLFGVALFALSGSVEATPPLPLPEARVDFDVPETDPAGWAARWITRHVPRVRNYRAEIADATWVRDDSALWSIRGTEECYAELERTGVPFKRAAQPTRKVPSPVRIEGEVLGVRFNRMILSCELALRLPRMIEVLRELDLVEVSVMSAYRPQPSSSFHTLGLALDLRHFKDSKGQVYSVLRDYWETPGVETCSAPAAPLAHRARALWQLACRLHELRVFSSVLTPNYNAGHRNHFHVDIRPDDPRYFIR
jgi:hypothetical protein